MTKFPLLQARWISLMARQGVAEEKAARAFQLVEHRYGEMHRSYHTLGCHISPLMAEFDAVKERTTCPDVVECALFLHDVIYDVVPGMKNEERSGKFTERLLKALGIKNQSFIVSVVEGILATRHDGAKQYSYDSLLVADIDLSGFSRDIDQALESTRRIRFEYSEVPHEVFVQGHRRILEMLASRPLIYHTAVFNWRCAKAKETIAKIIEELPELARRPLPPR